jgi:hypothetical protein
MEQARKYWIGVVSHAHVKRGVDEGIAQLCHGKAAPLRRMQRGDWLVYYSPRAEFRGSEPCQAFTAIGQVADDVIYECQLSEDFIPSRRAINYLPCQQAPIQPLLDQLSFSRKNRNWGFLFRRGHFEISEADFRHIAEAMHVEGLIFAESI